jgi:hypothetical protein
MNLIKMSWAKFWALFANSSGHPAHVLPQGPKSKLFWMSPNQVSSGFSAIFPILGEKLASFLHKLLGSL